MNNNEPNKTERRKLLFPWMALLRTVRLTAIPVVLALAVAGTILGASAYIGDFDHLFGTPTYSI